MFIYVGNIRGMLNIGINLMSQVIIVTRWVKIYTIFERKIVNIFLPISFNICLGCSEELSH